MGALGRTIIKFYASCGLLHVLIKLIRMLVKKRRMLKAFQNVPRSRYEDSLIGSVTEFLKHIHRRHDWANEVTLGLPLCYSEAGPKFDPDNVELQVRDPAIIKHVLKDNFDNYTKPEREIFWDNLRQRKIASNIFNRINFNSNMNDIFVAKGLRMCELLKGPALKGEAVDMQAKFFQYTMDSIMQIFFGEPADTMGGHTNDYALAYDTAHRCLIEYFFTSIPALAVCKLFPWPFGGVNGLASKMHRHTHPLYAEFKEAWKTLDGESRRMVEACRADEKLRERKDLLALFVQAEAEDQSMTTEWLRDVVLNMVIAGRDTTACTLSWMFYILATHPEIQQKLQEEIDSKFKVDAKPTLQSLSANELPYLNGVLYETLRLYPPVPQEVKTASKDDVLPGGTQILGGTRIAFLVYALGRDPKNYPDPEVVRPERWIPFNEPSQFEFPVFQAGPRVCLGMSMAIFEAKIAALMILRQFSFDMSPSEASKITYLPTALTLSICNTKGTGQGDNKFDSHKLWLTPHLREHMNDRVGPS
eukprot:TRINITY_DN31187_c0_g1_i2.p1 TRINITY_DN31187_c0_g1~~TRINITY_DN31187_c0_g1_i2.p1  ORF type:complete len:531 (+),score=61.62 TRINITY_DN31187_c0_g1_i2:68-1660(+)